MVNPEFAQNFQHYLTKDLQGQMAGQPAIFQGGAQQDHYKGLSRSVASSVIPFYKESYTPTEFMFGWVPLNNPAVPVLYFQFPVLDVKGKNICGAGQFATFVKAPIPETIITPFVGWSNKYVPMSKVGSDGATPKEVFKNQVGFTPLLLAMNEDKKALKANSPAIVEAQVGNFKVKVNSLSPVGLTQLAPYKGYTIITSQTAPSLKAGVNKPVYTYDDAIEKFGVIASFVARFPQQGQGIGQQFVGRSNAAMMDALYKQIDSMVPNWTEAPPAPPAAAVPPPPPAYVAPPAPTYSPPAPPAPTYAPPAPVAPPEPAPAPEMFPCPTCGGGIRFGFKFCPHCKQELVWD